MANDIKDIRDLIRKGKVEQLLSSVSFRTGFLTTQQQRKELVADIYTLCVLQNKFTEYESMLHIWTAWLGPSLTEYLSSLPKGSKICIKQYRKYLETVRSNNDISGIVTLLFTQGHVTAEVLEMTLRQIGDTYLEEYNMQPIIETVRCNPSLLSCLNLLASKIDWNSLSTESMDSLFSGLTPDVTPRDIDVCRVLYRNILSRNVSLLYNSESYIDVLTYDDHARVYLAQPYTYLSILGLESYKFKCVRKRLQKYFQTYFYPLFTPYVGLASTRTIITEYI